MVENSEDGLLLVQGVRDSSVSEVVHLSCQCHVSRAGMSGSGVSCDERGRGAFGREASPVDVWVRDDEFQFSVGERVVYRAVLIYNPFNGGKGRNPLCISCRCFSATPC
jgi:hypothetical protein